MNHLDLDLLAQQTEAYGGAWGLNHTRRLLALVSQIGEGQRYDPLIVQTAAYLHDWGAYHLWAQAGVDHAVRSTQVAETVLADLDLSPEFIAAVLECIATHHGGDPSRRMEAILLSDADALDFLGVVGILRDFSKNSRNLRLAYETVQKRRQTIPAHLCLEKSRQLAVPRLQEMDQFLAAFDAETFGYF